MHSIKYLAALAATVAGLSLAVTGPATAATNTRQPSNAETGTRVQRVALGNGATLLRGVTSPEQLAVECDDGSFCGYGYNPYVGGSYAVEWDYCTWDPDIPWVGAGWWFNRLPGNTRDRVAMYDADSVEIYRTPHSPVNDETANWTPVYQLQTCVS